MSVVFIQHRAPGATRVTPYVAKHMHLFISIAIETLERPESTKSVSSAGENA